MIKKTILFFVKLPRFVLVWFIRLYQFLLSPDHSFWAKATYPDGFCRFYPSCSEYGLQVIKKRGVVVGLAKLSWRIVRCNPWNKGGVDLPK